MNLNTKLNKIFEEIFETKKYLALSEDNQIILKLLYSKNKFRTATQDEISLYCFIDNINIISSIIGRRFLLISRNDNHHKTINKQAYSINKSNFKNLLFIDNSFKRLDLEKFKFKFSSKYNTKINNDLKITNSNLKKLISEKIKYENEIKGYLSIINRIKTIINRLKNKENYIKDILNKIKINNKEKEAQIYLGIIIKFLKKKQKNNKLLIKDILVLKLIITKLSKIIEYKVPFEIIKSEKIIFLFLEILNYEILKKEIAQRLNKYNFHSNNYKIYTLIKELYNPDSPEFSKCFLSIKERSENFFFDNLNNYDSNLIKSTLDIVSFFPIVFINLNFFKLFDGLKFDYIINLDQEVLNENHIRLLSLNNKNIINNIPIKKKLEEIKVRQNVITNNDIEIDIYKNLLNHKQQINRDIEIKKDISIENVNYDFFIQDIKRNKKLIIKLNNMQPKNKINLQLTSKRHYYLDNYINLITNQISIYEINLINILKSQRTQYYMKEMHKLKTFINYFFNDAINI